MSDHHKRGLLTRLLSSIGFLIAPDLNTDDRRAVPRLPCSKTVKFVSDTGVPGTAELLEVSSRGLRLSTDMALTKGRTLALNPPDDAELEIYAPIMAHVVWSSSQGPSKHLLGLAVPDELQDETTWLDSMLASLGYNDDGSQRRQHIRAEAEIEGWLLVDDQAEEQSVQISVMNLGMGGALLRSASTFPKDAQFKLSIGPHDDLPQLDLLGTILRVIKKESFTLHPCRFRPLDERDDKILREYILNLLDR